MFCEIFFPRLHRPRRLIDFVRIDFNDDEEETSVFLLYSFSRHEVVRRAMVADGAVDFEANEDFIVIVCLLSSPYLHLF